MATWFIRLAVLTVVLVPTMGSGQGMQLPTSPPEVTAANASWQLNSEPIVVQGLVYDPTRDTRMFDGQVMTRIGVYEGVPVYADATLEPFSVVFVPIGRERMRTYERPSAGELASTTGSRAPTFSVAPAHRPAYPGPAGERVGGTSGATIPGPSAPPSGEPGVVGTGGTLALDAATTRATPVDQTASARTRGRVESIPRPSGSNGVWLEFNGARWYSAGPAVPFTSARFTPVG